MDLYLLEPSADKEFLKFLWAIPDIPRYGALLFARRAQIEDNIGKQESSSGLKHSIDLSKQLTWISK